MQAIGAAGDAHVDLKSANSVPCNGAVQIVPGASWNFHYWHRQPMSQAATLSSELRDGEPPPAAQWTRSSTSLSPARSSNHSGSKARSPGSARTV